MKLIIFAGGSGSRLWPVSRKKIPKQIHSLVGKKTLLQQTYLRLRRGFRPQDIHIATLTEHISFIKKQLPRFPLENISAEPLRKETAAAILLAAARIHKKNPQDEFVNIWSDHFIKNEPAYIQTLRAAQQAVRSFPGHLVMVGVNPTYPETGYGYIKMGKPVGQIGQHEVFKVDRFEEKPTLAVAKKYLQDWRYLWNPTMLVAKTATLLEMYREHLPASYRIIMEEVFPHLGTSREAKTLAHWYPRLQKIAIDYAILEKAKNLLVMPSDFGWVDVGSWRTVKEVLSQHEDDVITEGQVVHRDTKDVLAYSYNKNKIVAIIGMEKCVVIDTPDALLVCHKEKAQDVKKIVEYLEEKSKRQYL